MHLLSDGPYNAVGIDIQPGPTTHHVGSICDREFIRSHMSGVDAVIHTATLHKPHIVTHSRQDFIDVNVNGTLVLLEEADAAGIDRFVFTSTTSAFGEALVPPEGEPAAWITETVSPIPKNIYGLTKVAAEDLCYLFYRERRMATLVLRTSRFFPEEDDSVQVRSAFSDQNAKANEFLHRRVDIEDAAKAHLAAVERATEIGFGKYIISATTPFTKDDLAEVRSDPNAILRKRFPEFENEYRRREWRMFDRLDRIYVSEMARNQLGWAPVYDFRYVLDQLIADQPIGSDLSRRIGSKGYHSETFEDGPYPTG